MWNKDGKTSYTYCWIKNVNLIPDHFPTNFYSSQALTGHGRFLFYFSRFRITQASTCKCSKDIENFDHYLTECPILINDRKRLVIKLGQHLENRKPEIIRKEETRIILEDIVLKITNSFYKHKNTPNIAENQHDQ